MSYLKKNMKFGIKVPTSVDHALKIDKCDGNTLWADTIAKEMKDVSTPRPLATSGLNATQFLTSKLRTSEGWLVWLLGGT
jgi:hypothetical protein